MALRPTTPSLLLAVALVLAACCPGAGGCEGGGAGCFLDDSLIGCAPPQPAGTPVSDDGTAFRVSLAPLLAALPSAAAATGFATLRSAGAAGRAHAFGLCFGGGDGAALSGPDCLACLSAAVAAVIVGRDNDTHRASVWRDGCLVAYADDGASEDGGFRQGFVAGGLRPFHDILDQRLADLAKALAKPKGKSLWRMALSLLFYALAAVGAVAILLLMCVFMAGYQLAQTLDQHAASEQPPAQLKSIRILVAQSAGEVKGFEDLDNQETLRRRYAVRGEIKKRFGRCPHCRAMICQNHDAAIFYSSKCRTPIRGENSEPTYKSDQPLSRTDELDACQTEASVFDVNSDQRPSFSSSTYCSYFNANSQGAAPTPSSSSSPYGGFNSARRVHPLNNGANRSLRFDDGVVDSSEQDEVRPLSRRSRHPWSSDSSVLRYGVFMSTYSEDFSSTGNAYERRRQPSRRSVLGSQELETWTALSGPEPSAVAASPLADSAFQREVLLSLDKLRGLMIGAIERTSSSARAAARRDARLFRWLESHLQRALPLEEHGLCRDASGTGSMPSPNGGGDRERRKDLYRPVLGGAPFVVCGSCFELVQTSAATVPSRRMVARLAVAARKWSS